MRSRALFPLLVVCLGAALLGQEPDPYLTNHNLKGVNPFGSYQFAEIDAINLGTGSVELTIPLFERTGRGLNYSRVLTYSSKICSASYDPIPTTPTLSMLVKSGANNPNIRGVAGELSWNEDMSFDCAGTDPPEPLVVRANFTYRSASGATFRFPNRIVRYQNSEPNESCVELDNGNTQVPEGTSDNGFMRLVTGTTSGDYILYFKDGRREIFEPNMSGDVDGTPDQVIDSNGNYQSLGTDTLGRSHSGGSTSYQDSGGTTRSFTLSPTNGRTFDASTGFTEDIIMCGGASVEYLGGPASVGLFDYTLSLPNGLEYVLEFNDDYGELEKVTLPEGGYIRYEYAFKLLFDRGPEPCVTAGVDSRRVVKRAVCEKASCTAMEEKVWTYAYDDNPDYVTTVTNPDGTQSVHTFDTDGIHEVDAETLDDSSNTLQLVERT